MSQKKGGAIIEKLRAWFELGEHRMLLWANRRPINRFVSTWLSRWLGCVTHIGGATFTLVTALCIGLFAGYPWNVAGWQSLTAVAVSHIPVFIAKRKFKRLRPFQALDNVNIGKRILIDPSFPSGHTTAVFAWMLPLLYADSSLMPLLLPAAVVLLLSVAWSRMYLGLHYPSDVIAGAVVGSLTASLVSLFWWSA